MIGKGCIWAAATWVLLTHSAWAQPSVAIRNARIVTVSGETIERGTVVVENGRIADVGVRVSIPGRARIIDGRELTVYPGLFNCDTQIGLTEIGQVTVGNDYNEMGEYTPHLLAFSAFHVESEHLPVALVDGITHVLTRPSGGIIPGQGAVMNLAGWSPEEMEIERHAAMILSLPSLLPLRRGFFGSSRRLSYSEQKKEFEEKISQLKELFSKARHYHQAREKGLEVAYDEQLHALGPLLEGEQPVLIEADSHIDIQEAVEFAQSENLDFIILGARDAWKIPDFLAEKKVRVILGPTQTLPVREDDPIDIVYRTAAILHASGVRFALSTGGSADVRTLPFEAGNAVAYGLPHEVALRAITLTPAEFLRLAEQLGSLEKGKRANLVVTDGDIFEYQTKILHVFIDGQPVSLESKHTRLYEKYLARP